MKKGLFVFTILLLALCSCSNDEQLLEMIPHDATGVVCFDLQKILKKSGIENDGKIELPQELQNTIKQNDDASWCGIIKNLPNMGIDPKSKAYCFMTTKTYGLSFLVCLDDDSQAIDFIQRQNGTKAKEADGYNYIYLGDYFYAVKDGVLFVGRFNRPIDEQGALKAAKRLFAKTDKSIKTDKDIEEQLEEGDVSAFFKVKGLKTLLDMSETYRDIASKFPLITLFTESDIDAFSFNATATEKEIDIKTKIKAAKTSEYATLMNLTLGQPSASVLLAIPNSMKYIASMSVKGNEFVKLPQVGQIVKVIQSMPYFDRLDIASMLNDVDGPIAVGMSPDPTFVGQWNAVIAAKVKSPKLIISKISHFATGLGQAPELYDNEYVYEYNNKAIVVGERQNVLYIKMLDYEQTEGYANTIPGLNQFFNGNKFGLVLQTAANQKNGFFTYGLKDPYNAEGKFYCSDTKANPLLYLMECVCSIKPDSQFSQENFDLMPTE